MIDTLAVDRFHADDEPAPICDFCGWEDRTPDWIIDAIREPQPGQPRTELTVQLCRFCFRSNAAASWLAGHEDDWTVARDQARAFNMLRAELLLAVGPPDLRVVALQHAFAEGGGGALELADRRRMMQRADAIHAWLAQDRVAVSTVERTCRVCGCTDAKACVLDDVPCHWVALNVCSGCSR